MTHANPAIGSEIHVHQIDGSITAGIVMGYGTKDGKQTIEYLGHHKLSSQLSEPSSRWAWPDQLVKPTKNVLGQDAAKPFYIWANDDCANKTDSFKEAKAIRLVLFNEGGESVHIVDAEGVEVVDTEIEAHEALARAGYFAGPRKPDVNPDLPGAFMVNDPIDLDGYAIVGDDIAELIMEAWDHLIDPSGDNPVGVKP